MKTIKLVIAAIVFCVSLNSLAQAKIVTGKTDIQDVKIENVSITVEVDSADEIESTFKVEDLEDIFENAQSGEDISFKLKCNGRKMSNGVRSSMSYTINGNTNDKASFLEGVAKVRASAIKYYKSKN